MTSSGIRLTHLLLMGPGAPNAEVQFAAGLNVIVGASNTGKTYVAQCVDFMFGGSRPPKEIPEAAAYDTVRLGLQLGQQEWVLERSLRGGDFRIFGRDQHEPRVLGAKHQPDKDDTVSHLLLDASGLSGKKVKTNQQGKTRGLSFRDIARLVLVDETSVIAQRSPIFSGQQTSRTAENAVFRLMLTGIDYSSVIAKEDPKVVKGRREGKSEVLEEFLEKAREQAQEQGVVETEDQLNERFEQLEAAANAAAQVLTAEQQSASALEDNRKSAWQRLRHVDSRMAVLTELQKRFTLLHDQYESDLRRLEAVSEASVRLGQMKEERCPVCGALAEHQETEHQHEHASLEEVAGASTAEAAKIRTLLADLGKTLAANEAEILRLKREREEKRKALDDAGQELSDTLRPRVQEALQKHRERLVDRDKVRRALDLLARVRELESLLAEVEAAPKRERAEGPSTAVGADEAEEFSLEVEGLLRSWHFPNLERVTFSEEDQDVVISGQRRASHGKGVRAITHAAFNLALMKYCRDRAKPHPGMVLIDSPLIVYRQPDAGEDTFTTDVKAAFYRVLAGQYASSQVIVLENDAPPADLVGAINVIEFTGAEQGRSGFIPRAG